MSSNRPFDQPVPLPSGPPARTLRAAADYIKKLPQAEHDSPDWQIAIGMLIEAAEDRGPMMSPKWRSIGAVNCNFERPINKSPKDHHWGRKKLARISERGWKIPWR
jgi:hypothetical protein